MMKKLILTDVDGVLLDWEEGFRIWMEHEYGYTRCGDLTAYRLADHYELPEPVIWDRVVEFNSSAHAAFLRPHGEAGHYIKRLADKGFRFVTCTSFGGTTASQALRRYNLESLFGDVFEEHNIIELCGNKREVLARWEGEQLWWIEDNLHNAKIGLELGLRPILMEHTHNADADEDFILKARGWREVYTIITGEEEYAD
jgi:phosphoglycolate phosphatase-like HAD superfamily hydrolase